ncbi:MAG: hypothetical protein IKA32_04760 [Lentisphaeria bacterium]|nr:hypothetical protein [Lentisphaeria bacterium]
MDCPVGAVRVKPCKSENFEISTFEVTEKKAKFFNLQQMMARQRRFISPGTYTQITGKGRGIIMSNTPAEIGGHMEFYHAATGRVMIGGLGIGMILEAVLKKPEVTSITVIEKEQEIIDLVSPFYANEEKIKIVCGDVFSPQDYLAPGTKFDRLYFDIWDTINADNYPEMKDLNIKWRKYKAPGGKAYFWEKSICKREYFA